MAQEYPQEKGGQNDKRYVDPFDLSWKSYQPEPEPEQPSDPAKEER